MVLNNYKKICSDLDLLRCIDIKVTSIWSTMFFLVLNIQTEMRINDLIDFGKDRSLLTTIIPVKRYKSKSIHSITLRLLTLFDISIGPTKQRQLNPPTLSPPSPQTMVHFCGQIFQSGRVRKT